MCVCCWGGGGVENWERAKVKVGAEEYEACTCFMTLDVMKNTSSKYVGR
jgi:hypothetical protein